MKKDGTDYDLVWNADDSGDVFALKGYMINDGVRAFIIKCQDNIPMRWAYDISRGILIELIRDKYDLIDDNLMQEKLSKQTDVIGTDLCDYNSLKIIGCGSVKEFLDALQLPTLSIIRVLNLENSHKREK